MVIEETWNRSEALDLHELVDKLAYHEDKLQKLSNSEVDNVGLTINKKESELNSILSSLVDGVSNYEVSRYQKELHELSIQEETF